MNILVVEDDPIAIEIINEILKKFSNVTIAKDGEEGLLEYKKSLLNKEFDKVFLDLMLPELNGIDLLKEINKIKKNCKVYVMSAIDDETIKKEVLEIGCNGYILKPIITEKIKKIMEEG
ncbi:response regulator [Oceanotoga sp. DSM 15011]|jgi:DNA-binding response OmpR family regulator|uniref:Response regulator receiver domain-containing protein n=1 Tax=Oceanotoga teriensis TaxID=515440 RepID=A0AA45C6A3_9BACT|nr:MULTISPECIES: response regulator [Oceanotoga]MDN5343375.1 hypothetical protein [Oceanotoga sp.]MDO7975745.1 response regulator [Oceanotoga teriensis]PWJ91276.1 response regulator receiver domain-containing protein [Oceanotoga teriensis]UYO99751.1 response regulator [Oceanotoga sp. DSM 15011]